MPTIDGRLKRHFPKLRLKTLSTVEADQRKSAVAQPFPILFLCIEVPAQPESVPPIDSPVQR
jgi:hypothetical protein